MAIGRPCARHSGQPSNWLHSRRAHSKQARRCPHPDQAQQASFSSSRQIEQCGVSIETEMSFAGSDATRAAPG